jgi:phage repressor protein C with HTH and peptisase S24 domain
MDGLEQDRALLQALVEFEGITPTALAREAGLADTTISRPLNGKASTRLSSPTIEKLRARFPNFPGWVTDRTSSATAEDDTIEIEQIDLRYGLGGAFLDEDQIQAEPGKFPARWIRSITRSRPELLFWGTGRGDSMAPTIIDGALVLGDRSQTIPRDDDLIWACTYGSIGMIKRLRVRPGHVELLSDNPLVPNETIVPDNDFRIIGRIVAVVNNL